MNIVELFMVLSFFEDSRQGRFCLCRVVHSLASLCEGLSLTHGATSCPSAVLGYVQLQLSQDVSMDPTVRFMIVTCLLSPTVRFVIVTCLLSPSQRSVLSHPATLQQSAELCGLTG